MFSLSSWLTTTRSLVFRNDKWDASITVELTDLQTAARQIDT
jgi:hypothetical protein